MFSGGAGVSIGIDWGDGELSGGDCFTKVLITIKAEIVREIIDATTIRISTKRFLFSFVSSFSILLARHERTANLSVFACTGIARVLKPLAIGICFAFIRAGLSRISIPFLTREFKCGEDLV